MRKKFAIPIVILSLLLINGCKKEEKPSVPVITTTEVTEISYTTATSGGEVTDDGGAPVTSKGVCWHTVVNPIVQDSKTTEPGGTGSFSTNITHLIPNTLYYVRAYATNSSGTGYGEQVSFTTMQTLTPVITTTAITSIKSTTAVAGGSITNENGAAVTERGVCWSTNPDPLTTDNKTTEGTGPGIFSCTLTGLTPNTTYYLKAYAINSEGTSYGEVLSLKTFAADDIDGNVYTSVTIGTQTWLVENLKTTKYNDGTLIPLVVDSAQWVNSTSPGYCWYNNDESTFKSLYGALYNWYSVNTGKLCPSGWHVPTDAEWTTLSNFLGGNSVSGGKLKETGFNHWNTPNTGATNEVDFTALPGGFRNIYDFESVKYYGAWWSSTTTLSTPTSAHDRSISYYWSKLYTWEYGSQKFHGYSVRCLKD